MAIKQSYEISIWSEILGENGQKIEHKDFIIGGNDMEYLGRATSIKFEKKLDGTHTLTFSMPDSFYDSRVGEYVQNEFVEQLYNERKVKFYFKKEWYEFYIKSISDSKIHKALMKTYTCSDAFIDELSRNGYGITFDEELYNNVEEIGTFTNEILEDSIWRYSPENNWGDFTEYLEEKLYKIPVSQFSKIVGYKLNFNVDDSNDKIVNLYTGEKRGIEMSDDLASGKYFWDQLGGRNLLLKKETEEIENDGFIYVPISQLDFCYKTTAAGAILTATEEIISIPNHSYALAPATIDPSAFIQFIAIPKDAVVEIDESGLIVNKDFTYIMTVEQWNESLKHNKWFYEFEPFNQFQNGVKRTIKSFKEEGSTATGNYCAYYEGYLNSIGNQEVVNGKKISISDRTEINPTDDIDQFVNIYNTTANLLNNEDIYTIMLEDSEDWIVNNNPDYDTYRICSKIETRQVVPQLARNLIQNGVNIKSTDGWEVADLNVETGQNPATISFTKDEEFGSRLILTKSSNSSELNNMIINFGICAQEVELNSEKVYCFGYEGHLNSNCKLVIGEGIIQGTGNYSINYSKGYSNTFNIFDEKINRTFTFLKVNKEIKNPYIAIILDGDEEQYIKEMWFFECFTRGIDQFETGAFKYSGRQLFEESLKNLYGSEEREVGLNKSYEKWECQQIVLFEDSIMPGDTYSYQEYFIQQVQARKIDENNEVKIITNDTFMAKEFISPNGNLSSRDLPYSSKEFTQDDLTFVTRKYNMNKCPYYKEGSLANECDCCYPCAAGEGDKLCMYQKYGYCPYLFQTEKHCRKIRTLKQEKSNRFNLTQELSKVFEIYPVYWTQFNSQGKILFNEDGSMDKRIFYITEKGKENKLGFRYEKNLSNISRTLKSDQIVTKLYVEDVDSEFSNTGLCSIKTAPDNISKDNFIIDMSYYVSKGILDEEQLERDLYGKEEGDLAYLKQLGYYNTEYDKLSNLIINLSSESFTELEANIEVNLEAILTAQQQLLKLKKQLSKYGFNDPYDRELKNENGEIIEANSSVQNMFTKYDEQEGILQELFNETFCSNNIAGEGYTLENLSIDNFKESDDYKYHTYSYGMLGQYNNEYKQIQEWRRRQAILLNKINTLSLRFYKKYEPYLKEGTWTDRNYLTDNAYYHGAIEVATDGSIPKVSYSIIVVDLSSLPNGENYEFDIADTTYVEDPSMFGINKKTGMPNRLKVLISGITYNPDQPTSNTINVQNFTTQFEDLFKQVSASVQSLTFNENIYKRSSNFTSNQTLKETAIQGTLDNNNLTLLNTQEKNIELDSQGQQGSDINNHSNKYKLNGQGLYFSNNGGQSWNVGVGPSGINADYIKVGNLDAGKIKIVDNDYLYFYWDKDGIVALKQPSNINETAFNNFAIFNRTGLSLVENNQVRLRAGYDLSSAGGVFNSQEETFGDIGFYLYDLSGHKIFSTRNDNDLSARIDLRGELCANGGSVLNIIDTTYSDCFKLNSVNCNRYFAINDDDELELIILDNGDNLKNKLIEFFNNSTNLLDTQSVFTAAGDEIIINRNIENVLINSNNYYKTNVVVLEINGTINCNGKYLYESNQTIYKQTDIQPINLIENISNKQYTANNFELPSENISYYVGGEQTAGGGYYPYQIENEEKYYYRNSTISRTESVESNDTIAVYINNMDVGNNSSNTTKRIFSCVKFNTNNTISNLFSILTDGSVYLGGTVNTNNPNQKVDNFDYNISISGNNLLKLDPNGRIYFGNQDIVGNLQDQINEIASRGIIPHKHYFKAFFNNGFWLNDGWNNIQIQTTNGTTNLWEIFQYLEIGNWTENAEVN